ncbi:MAG: GNAT family N-acetyltransferase [Verrucomicrobiota bacterium]
MDMLIKLYVLPERKSLPPGYALRRILPSEGSRCAEFVAEEFSRGWADEFLVAVGMQPPRAFIALDAEGSIAGFSCYDAAFKGFFGPIGVLESHRGLGLGRALTLEALFAMQAEGYAYAVAGWVSDEGFYREQFGAEVIPDSEPGAYGRKIG